MHPSTLDFQKDVLDASETMPVVVDFWASWCAPCRILGPVLEKLAGEANGAWKLAKISTEEHPELAAQYGIRSIPAVKMFSRGEVTAEFVGALPEGQIRRWLEEHIPTEAGRLLAAANKALAAGDTDDAKAGYEKVLELAPENVEARTALARLVFANDPGLAAELAQGTPPESPHFQAAESILTLNRLLNTPPVAGGGEPSAAWKDYLAGVEALQRQEYETALKSWIDAILVDRSIDGDGPRKACIALFSILGQEHELTRKYHRAFTSALF